jgi:hypothetical protein
VAYVGPPLSAAVTSAVAPFPPALPVGHVTTARRFTSILASGVLAATHCPVMKAPTLYLSYGEAQYRLGGEGTREAAKLPVVLVFHPRMLKVVDSYFPFDTGALLTGRFGSWRDRLAPLDPGFRLPGNGDSDTPARLVQRLFGDNSRYRRGEASSDLPTKEDPLPLLHEFLTTDLSSHGADSRQCAIECQVRTDIRLDDSLLFAGFPVSMLAKFDAFCRTIRPHIPQFYAYDAPVIHHPRDMTARIVERARTVIDPFIAFPGGSV